MNGFNICFPDFCILQLLRSKKTRHKVSVIHVAQPKICPIHIVVSDIADQIVTNLQLNILNYKRNPSVTLLGNYGKIIKNLKYILYHIL